MKILSLGHSAFLLEMESEKAEAPVRILVDPWITDHAIGDLLGRFPRIRLDLSALAPIDFVYLSHAHTDHLDPDSLLLLFAELSPPPAILLPESLAYLEDLLVSFLAGATVEVLHAEKPISVRGVRLTGFFNVAPRATNEDDVMVFVADNGREVLLSESDAVLPLDDPETRAFVASFFDRPEIESSCFLSTRNELDATMAMIGAESTNERDRRIGACLDEMTDETYRMLSPATDEGPDLFENRRLVRLIGGQGLCWPQQLGTDFNRRLFPIRRSDRVSMEREAAENLGCLHRVEELVPGWVHVVSGGGFEHHAEPLVELLDREEDRIFDPGLPPLPPFPCSPLHEEARDAGRQRDLVLETLNRRFLPHLVGLREPPVEQILTHGSGAYRIRVRYGGADRFDVREYAISFRDLSFREVRAKDGEPDEEYWANDIEDFLAGRADEFSVTCRRPAGGRFQRLWHCLGMPYLNNDLVERKLRLHFERAALGKTSSEFVLAHYRDRNPG